MSAALQHPIGPNTVDDWMALDPPEDGSSLELILGYFSVVPPPGGRHQLGAARLWHVLDAALRDAGRSDLHAVPGVGVNISYGFRTSLIPDIAILNTRPVETVFEAENLVMAVEIWSPGNTHGERESKIAAYAGAGVPFLWTAEFDRFGAELSVTAHRLVRGQYVAEVTAKPGVATTIEAAPVPVTFDPADLVP